MVRKACLVFRYSKSLKTYILLFTCTIIIVSTPGSSFYFIPLDEEEQAYNNISILLTTLLLIIICLFILYSVWKNKKINYLKKELQLQNEKFAAEEKIRKLSYDDDESQREISAKKKLEEELKESESKFAKIFMESPIGMGLIDAGDFKVIDVNKVFQNLYGFTREEAIGKTTLELNLYQDINNRAKIISMIKKGEMLKDFELYTKQRDGYIRIVSLNTELIFIENKVTLLVVARDITERKKAENALKESEERLKIAQEMAHLGSWELDLEKNELTWSDEVYRILGFEPQQLAGTYETFLDMVHPDDRNIVNESYTSSIREGNDCYENSHRIIRKKTNEIRIVHEKCNHFKDSSGKIIRSVGMVHDITEQKLQEQKLEAAMIELQRSNKDLEQFAYIASHDLQEPIRIIRNFTQLIEIKNKETLTNEAKLYFTFVKDGAVRMQNLIDDLLKYSRISTVEIIPENVDCNIVVENVLVDLQLRIKEENAIISFEELPVIKGNKTQLRQLFQNFLNNALKFRSENIPEIKITCKKNNEFWIFAISDNGIGINPLYFDKIFIAFQRLHNKEIYPGNGIGLAICKKIVERLGGQVSVDSEIGKGTTFYFTLPA